LPHLPRGWFWFRIADLCEVVRGGSPRSAGDPKYYGGTIPFLKVADITQRPGAYLDTYTYSIKEAGLQKTRLVRPSTLLLSNSGATLGVPKICVIEATFNDGIAAFLGLEKSRLLYHYYFWLSKTNELRAINQGAAQPNLNTNLIEQVFIPLCGADEMEIVTSEIEKAFSVSEQLIKEVEKQLEKTERLRPSILKNAFSGKLVAQDPNDESAATLLERIKAEKAAKENGKKNNGRRKAA
jgi:type I restriction enzyme, S subunit